MIQKKYKYRYELLKKLGVDELQINRTIFKQLLFYFAIPMVLPVIISIPVILGVSQIFTVAVTMEEILRIFGLCLECLYWYMEFTLLQQMCSLIEI